MQYIYVSYTKAHTKKPNPKTTKNDQWINQAINQWIKQANKNRTNQPTNPTQPNPNQTKPTNVKVANRNNKRATTRRVTSKIYLDLLFSLRAWATFRGIFLFHWWIREFICTSTGCFSFTKNTQKLIISNLHILNSLLGWIPVVVFPTKSKQQRGSWEPLEVGTDHRGHIDLDQYCAEIDVTDLQASLRDIQPNTKRVHKQRQVPKWRVNDMSKVQPVRVLTWNPKPQMYTQLKRKAPRWTPSRQNRSAQNSKNLTWIKVQKLTVVNSNCFC